MSYKSRGSWGTRYKEGQYERIFKRKKKGSERRDTKSGTNPSQPGNGIVITCDRGKWSVRKSTIK